MTNTADAHKAGRVSLTGYSSEDTPTTSAPPSPLISYDDWMDTTGWLQISQKRRKIPGRACYIGQYGKCFVYVEPGHEAELTEFTLAILDIATLDPKVRTIGTAAPSGAANTDATKAESDLLTLQTKIESEKTNHEARTAKVAPNLLMNPKDITFLESAQLLPLESYHTSVLNALNAEMEAATRRLEAAKIRMQIQSLNSDSLLTPRLQQVVPAPPPTMSN